MKDGSSLVVTPSFIPNFATRGPNAILSSKGSEEVLEDYDDESTMKKRISYSNKEEGGDHEAETMGMYLPCLLSFFFFPPFIIAFFFLLLYIYIYIYMCVCVCLCVCVCVCNLLM